MLKFLAAMAAVASITGAAIAGPAKPAFTGTDFSGVYDCKGNDAHDGDYQGAYTLTSEVPGLGTYTGSPASS